MAINWVSQITGPNGQLPYSPAKIGFGVYNRPAQNATIYRVTNLNTSGAGSLQEAISASGKRVVIFEVSGRIDYGSSNFLINNDDIHIAGQTAPRPGICIQANRCVVRSSNTVIEHVRFMSTDEHTNSNENSSSGYDNRDSLVIEGTPSVSNVVLNHLTCSFGVDGSLDVVRNVNNISIMNCIVALNLKYSIHARDAGNWNELDQHALIMLIDHFVKKIDITNCVVGFSEDRIPRCGAENFFYVNNVNPNTKRNRFVDLYTRNTSGSNANVFANIAGNRFITDRTSQAVCRVKGESGLDIEFYLNNNNLHFTQNGNDVNPTGATFLDLSENNGSYDLKGSPIASAIPHAQTIPSTPVNENFVLDNAGAFSGMKMPLESEIIQNAKDRTGEPVNSYSEVGNPRFDNVLNGGATYASGNDKPTVANRKNLSDKGWPNWRNWILSTSPMTRKRHTITDPDSVLSSGYTRLEAYLHACSRYVELREGGQRESEIDTQGRGWTP
ncbi:MAG: hypothetical protein AAGJ37_11950 [Pseudomonadota bacterium]